MSDGFGSKLRAGDFVITAEISPPLSSDPEDPLEKAMPLGGLANAVNITDGASARVHMSVLAAAAILVREGIEPVFQLTCRDRNRIALQSDLLGAAALGIRNLLTLTGDDPSASDQPEAKPVFDLNSARTAGLRAYAIRSATMPTRPSATAGPTRRPISTPGPKSAPGWRGSPRTGWRSMPGVTIRNLPMSSRWRGRCRRRQS